MKRNAVSLIFLAIFAFNAGCATIATPPIMAITTPISCIKESTRHDNIAETILVAVISPILIPIGLFAGMGLGLFTDLEADSIAYRDGFEIAVDPCGH